MSGPFVYKLHRLIVLSYEPLRRCLSQTEMATEKTGPECPTSSYSSLSLSVTIDSLTFSFSNKLSSRPEESYWLPTIGFEPESIFLVFFEEPETMLVLFCSFFSSKISPSFYPNFYSSIEDWIILRFSATYYLIISSTVSTLCYFLERMNTLMVLSERPVAMTAPESDNVTQFTFLYEFKIFREPIVGKFLCKFIFWDSCFSILSFRMVSSWGRGIWGL